MIKPTHPILVVRPEIDVSIGVVRRLGLLVATWPDDGSSTLGFMGAAATSCSPAPPLQLPVQSLFSVVLIAPSFPSLETGLLAQGFDASF